MSKKLVADIFDRTARVLSHRAGVNVVCRGNIITPHTDGKTIYLPSLPQPCPAVVERAWHGLVDHETAHLLFTDFNEIARFKIAQGKKCFAVLNVIEDLRCEAKMVQEYPGCGENLGRSYAYALERWSQTAPSLPLWNRFIGCLIATGKGLDSSIFGVDAIQVVDVVKDLVDLSPSTSSTQAAADIAIRIIERLKSYLDELNQRDEPAEELVALLEESSDSLAAEENEFTLGTVLKETIQEVSTGKNTDKPYRVYSFEHDVIEKAPDQSLSQYNEIWDVVRPLVSGLRQKLILTLRGKSKSRLVPSDEGTKLNRKRLHTLCLTVPSSPFMKKVEAPSGDVAVMLLVDHSGSMKGTKILLAQQCSILLTETMDQLHFPFAVEGFTTTHDRSYLSILRQNESQPVEEIEAEFARYIPIRYTSYKDFKEPFRSCRGRFAAMNANGYTPLNEAVLFGGKKLMEVKASRRLLIVLTDGAVYLGSKATQPIAERNLRENLEHLKQAGIEVLGVGIQAPYVQEVFAESIVVDDLSQLPQRFYEAVAHRLLR